MTEIIALIATVLIALFLGRHDAKKNTKLKQELEHEKAKAELVEKVGEIRDDVSNDSLAELRQRLRDH